MPERSPFAPETGLIPVKRTEELRELLEDITTVYHDERVDVKFGHPPRASPDGPTVYVDPNVREFLGRDLPGPQELRAIYDTLSHEIEHVRETDLETKRDIMADYPECQQFAGVIYNIVEDAYIDWHRCQRYPGLRATMAFVRDRIMENHHRRPRIDDKPKPDAVVEGLLQVSVAGYAKGFTDAPADVQRLVAWAHRRLEDARHAHDEADRKAIAREIINVYVDALGLDRANSLIDAADLPPMIEVIPDGFDPADAGDMPAKPYDPDGGDDDADDADLGGDGDGHGRPAPDSVIPDEHEGHSVRLVE